MELYIEKNYMLREITFYLETTDGGGKVFIGQRDGKMLFQKEVAAWEINKNPIEPLLRLDINLANDFIKKVAEYALSNGIATESEHTVKGKLVATEKHLEDLRKYFEMVLEKGLR